MTYKEQILQLLRREDMSCQQLTYEIGKNWLTRRGEIKYLSGSISSILLKMLKDGEIKLSKNKGPRGGKVYTL